VPSIFSCSRLAQVERGAIGLFRTYFRQCLIAWRWRYDLTACVMRSRPLVALMTACWSQSQQAQGRGAIPALRQFRPQQRDLAGQFRPKRVPWWKLLQLPYELGENVL
jgi:hypothetical protein